MSALSLRIPESLHLARAVTASESSAHEKRLGENANSMKKASAKRLDDDLRPQYDLSQLKGGVRGKYHRQAIAGTNLVLIERQLADVFPDAESVINRALRLLVDTAQAVAPLARRRPSALRKPPKQTPRRTGRGERR